MHFITSMQYFPVRTLEPMHSWRSLTKAPETALCSLLKKETSFMIQKKDMLTNTKHDLCYNIRVASYLSTILTVRTLSALTS